MEDGELDLNFVDDSFVDDFQDSQKIGDAPENGTQEPAKEKSEPQRAETEVEAPEHITATHHTEKPKLQPDTKTPEKPKEGPQSTPKSGGKSHSTSRYFLQDGVRCRNCGELGHKSASCTETRKVLCHTCACPEHRNSDCPSRICFNCFDVGHSGRECVLPRRGVNPCSICIRAGHVAKACSKPYYDCEALVKDGYVDVRCIVCGQVGHADCSEPIPLKDKKKYCWNCGSSEHDGLHCKEKSFRSLHFGTDDPVIIERKMREMQNAPRPPPPPLHMQQKYQQSPRGYYPPPAPAPQSHYPYPYQQPQQTPYFSQSPLYNYPAPQYGGASPYASLPVVTSLSQLHPPPQRSSSSEPYGGQPHSWDSHAPQRSDYHTQDVSRQVDDWSRQRARELEGDRYSAERPQQDSYRDASWEREREREGRERERERDRYREQDLHGHSTQDRRYADELRGQPLTQRGSGREGQRDYSSSAAATTRSSSSYSGHRYDPYARPSDRERGVGGQYATPSPLPVPPVMRESYRSQTSQGPSHYPQAYPPVDHYQAPPPPPPPPPPTNYPAPQPPYSFQPSGYYYPPPQNGYYYYGR